MKWHLRIANPWHDISGSFIEFSNKCQTFVVYEHEKDEDVSRTHCHMLIETDEVESEIRKQVAQSNKSNLKGNSLYMLSTEYKDKKRGKAKLIDDGLITYMSKGNLQYKYNKGCTEEFIKTCTMLWKNYKDVKEDTIEAEKLTKEIKCPECQAIKRVTDYQIFTEVLGELIKQDILAFNTKTYKDICNIIINVRKRYFKMTPQVKLQEYIFMIMNTDFETGETNVTKISMDKVASYLGFNTKYDR
jgi:hypothetical protein